MCLWRLEQKVVQRQVDGRETHQPVGHSLEG